MHDACKHLKTLKRTQADVNAASGPSFFLVSLAGSTLGTKSAVCTAAEYRSGKTVVPSRSREDWKFGPPYPPPYLCPRAKCEWVLDCGFMAGYWG